MKDTSLLKIIILLVTTLTCVSFGDLDSNKILLNSIVTKANTLFKNKFDTVIFNSERVNFYENQNGKLFYKAVRFVTNDSSGIVSFFAVKAPVWDDWKIRLKTSLSKNRSKQESDSIQNDVLNNIDNLLGGFGMPEEDWKKLRRMIDKDSMLIDEIKYWNTKK